jgi:hypothetical protein
VEHVDMMDDPGPRPLCHGGKPVNVLTIANLEDTTVQIAAGVPVLSGEPREEGLDVVAVDRNAAIEAPAGADR